MSLIEKITEMTAQDRVRYILNRAALELFPPHGHMNELAADIGVHPQTISVWIQRGDVPKPKALYMERRYGSDLTPANLLSLEIHANNSND